MQIHELIKYVFKWTHVLKMGISLKSNLKILNVVKNVAKDVSKYANLGNIGSTVFLLKTVIIIRK